jgi:hypothetical protein
MRIRNSAFALFLFALLACLPGGASIPREEGKLRIVELEGTPYRMGLTHGTALKSEITELIKRWKMDLAETYKVPAEEFVRKFLTRTDFRPSIDRWTPGLLDEVRGIADGAGVDFDTMFAFQLIDESWVMNEDIGLETCTAIAAGKREGSPAFTSQTQDIPLIYHGFPTVLRVRGNGENPEALVFTIPGVIALNGLNSRSVGVSVNAVTQLAHSPKGLPVAFVIRGILRQKTYEQAVKFLQDAPPAAPQNYALGGPQRAASFERSAGKMIAFLPFEGAEFTYHTNHPMANEPRSEVSCEIETGRSVPGEVQDVLSAVQLSRADAHGQCSADRSGFSEDDLRESRLEDQQRRNLRLYHHDAGREAGTSHFTRPSRCRAFPSSRFLESDGGPPLLVRPLYMRGLRNIVVHEYFGVDAGIIWHTAQNDLPPLAPPLRRILDEA